MNRLAPITAVAALALTIPAASATAEASASPQARNVNCAGRSDFLRIEENFKKTHCYADRGPWHYKYGMWVSKISTGNNNITWRADGHEYSLQRWHVLTFPHARTVLMTDFFIR